jgi:hypothetical protein
LVGGRGGKEDRKCGPVEGEEDKRRGRLDCLKTGEQRLRTSESILLGQENGQHGLAIVAGMAKGLEGDGFGWAARSEDEENLEAKLRAIRVDGGGEAEDLEEVPGSTGEALALVGELGRWVEIGAVDGLGDRDGDDEASLVGEVGEVNKHAVR